jgi:hypothetical protein
MVDDQVHHELDATPVQLCEQLIPIRQRAELIHDILVVADVVAIVVVG